MSEIIRACLARRLPSAVEVEEMAAITSNLWPAGKTFRVGLLGGTEAARSAVARAARVWESVANVHFKFVASAPADLRISFVPGGSWSYVGLDCAKVPAGYPTGNMGWPDDPGRDLHELGHALGLVHEHQWSEIPWNREECYRFYGSPPNNWSRQMVDQQVLARIPTDVLTTTRQWDGKSIMEYPIPRQLVADPAFATGWNQSLSRADVEMIRSLYPR